MCPKFKQLNIAVNSWFYIPVTIIGFLISKVDWMLSSYLYQDKGDL